jgi:hypothetical protein
MYCKNCGVELEDNMLICPLCGEPVDNNNYAGKVPVSSSAKGKQFQYHHTEMTRPQKKFTWEIVSITLLSAVIATFIIDFIISHRISWSEYPVAVCLTIFCYVSLFAFWDQRMIIKMSGGFILSSLSLIILDALTGSINWSARLGIPLLFVSNLIAAALIGIIRISKYKGINLVAYVFLGAALLCICIEGILSFFETGFLRFDWSVIVAACIIPVVIVLLFVHFRLKKGRNLEKTFHV